jgi:hypothetical protein
VLAHVELAQAAAHERWPVGTPGARPRRRRALAHAGNLINTGPKAFVQVLVTAVAGYFLYLVRRRTGNLVAAAVVHGLWDFSLLSGAVVPDHGHAGPIAGVLALVVLAVVVFVRRHHIEPARPTVHG